MAEALESKPVTQAKRAVRKTTAKASGEATKTVRKVKAKVAAEIPSKKTVTATVKESAASVKAAALKAADNVDWKGHADQIKDQAVKTARSAADTTKDATGSAMQGLSKLIADTAGTVDAKLGPQYGDYARYAAEAVAGAAKSLDAKDIDQLVGDARDFVRKSPAVAIGAAAVFGYVLMRLAKGSSSDA